MTLRDREMYLARAVADGSICLDAQRLSDLCVNLLATVEESSRVNVGLSSENVSLKHKLDGSFVHDEGVIPGLELAQMLINKALQNA